MLILLPLVLHRLNEFVVKLLQILEGRPGRWADADVNAEQAGAPSALGAGSPEFAMLKKSHDVWAGLRV